MISKANNLPQVLLVGPSFCGGGGEKLFVNLCGLLFAGKNDSCILAVNKNNIHPNNGNIFSLGWKNKLSYPKAIYKLRKIIKTGHYEVVFSLGFYPNILTWIATRTLLVRPKLIFSEITQPKTAYNLNSITGIIYYLLSWTIYPCCDFFTANSIDGINQSVKYFRVSLSKTAILKNLVDCDELLANAGKKPSFALPDREYLVVLSRLDPMKRIDLVINALARLSTRLDCQLVIIGDGPEKNRLEKQVTELNLSQKIVLTGELENPYPILKNAKAFILASEYEGFPNTVLEAMFCNVPVITSYCSSDAEEMCKAGAALGFKVADENGLCNCIIEIFHSKQLSHNLVSKAQKYCQAHNRVLAITEYENCVYRLSDRNSN